MAEFTDLESTTFSLKGDDHNSNDLYVRASDPIDGVTAVDGGRSRVPVSNGASISKKFRKSRNLGMEYGVDDLPALHMCFVFGLQVNCLF